MSLAEHETRRLSTALWNVLPCFMRIISFLLEDAQVNGRLMSPSEHTMFDFTNQAFTLWYVPKKQDRELLLCRSTWLSVFKQSIIWNQSYEPEWKPSTGGAVGRVGLTRTWCLLAQVSKGIHQSFKCLPSLLSPANAVFSSMVTARRGNTHYLIHLFPINFGFLIALGSPGCFISVLTLIWVWSMEKESEGKQNFGTVVFYSWRFLDGLVISVAEEVWRNARQWSFGCTAVLLNDGDQYIQLKLWACCNSLLAILQMAGGEQNRLKKKK